MEFSTFQIQPLDLDLLVEPDILGTRLTADLGNGRFVELHFPRGSGEALVAPSSVSRDVSGVLGTAGWGHAFQGNGGPVGSLSAVAFVGRFYVAKLKTIGPDDTVGGPELEALARQIDEWFRRWIAWCGVLASQAVQPDNPGIPTSSPRSFAVPRWVEMESGQRVDQNVSQTIRINVEALGGGISSERCAGTAVVSHAAASANARMDPPLSLQLRSGSHIAARRVGGSRLAVVEIGTAAERWLTEMLGLPSDHELTLGRLVTSASRAGLSVPDDAQMGLVKVRNDAIHRGVTPNKEVKMRALEIAEAIWGLSDSETHGLVAAQRLVARPLPLDLYL